MAEKNMNAKISVEFEETANRQQLSSGDNLPTLFGKIKKIISDLSTSAFSGSYIDLSDKPTTATTDTDGLMSAKDKSKLDNADNKYALKSKYGDTTINVGRKAGTDVGACSTAEGYGNTANGNYSHAEGEFTTASGGYSHAEGIHTTASGEMSHAEGNETTASGANSHAEGFETTASGLASHAGGIGTKALHDNEVAYGKYNESKDDTVFSVGDGTADDARHNAFEITTTGGKLHDKDIATTDLIPTELPANGGNADTLSLKPIDFFMHYRGEIVTNPDECEAIGMYQWFVPTTITNNPINYGTLIVSNANGYKIQVAISTDSSKVYIRCQTYSNGWGTWSNIADGGNADYAADTDKLDGLHANDFIKVNSSDAYDCNTLYDAGLYLCNGSATNTPNNLVYGTLLVMPYRKPYGNASMDYCAQIFIPNGDVVDTSMWYRTSLQNTWNEWKRSCDGGSADYATNAGNAEKLGGKDASAYSTSIIKSVTFSAATTNGYIWTGVPFPKYVIGVDLGHFDVIAQFYKGNHVDAARAEWAMMFFSKDDVTTPLNGSFNGVIYYID